MASLSVGTHHLHSTNQLKKLSFHSISSTPLSSLPYKSSFGSSLCKLRGSRILGNGLLASAEDKAKGPSSPPPSSLNKQQGQQPSIDNQLQDLEPKSGSCDPLCSLDETSSLDFEATYQPRADLVKALAISAAAATGAAAINLSWVAANQDLAMELLFGIGYAGIIFEESLAFNKSGVELLMAVSLWVIRSIGLYGSMIELVLTIFTRMHFSFEFCVLSSLEAAGLLRELANYLDAHIHHIELIASAIGVVSAIIDNVPLVAATMGMYDLSSFPQDHEFWQLVAYCAGTGGSMLVIGSAAGVAFMGMEKVDFFWYLRKVSGFAFAGYVAGIAAYLTVHNLSISLATHDSG
ncbi:hypothetical protein DKX38_025051 [Salix brachista]|uniref:Citrate transporter-like domain-containing protein n=1 Tax=Salix brachista TaxID=2182728 RepID=A0A5N5JNQ9_9ROSI|nr:hypothetical protein DKX38_025051 [Salix brachista]